MGGFSKGATEGRSRRQSARDKRGSEENKKRLRRLAEIEAEKVKHD